MTTHTTRASLIARIHSRQDEGAWNEFTSLYAPLIHAYGLKRGLQDSDAVDLVQEVLQTVMEGVGTFMHRGPGSFRAWLYTVTLNRIRRRHRLEKRQVAGSGRTTVARALLDHAEGVQEDWDWQYRMRVFQWAAEQVRGEFQDSSWQAFWLTSVAGRNPATVASELGMSLGSVYVAKCRIVKRIREKVAYADDVDGR